LFIAFALPIWFPLSPLLQELTADAVFWLARVFNISAYREYNVIMLPAGSLSIEEACSGLRYLMAALTLGALYARLNYIGIRAQSIVVLVFVTAAILANIIRVYIVVYLAYKTDMQHPWVADHLNLGWYIFSAVMLVLILLDAGLHKMIIADSAEKTADSPASKLTQTHHCRFGVLQILLLSLPAILLLGLAPVASWKIDSQSDIDPHEILIALPNGDADWYGPNAPVTGWKPVFRGAIDTIQSYTNANETIEIYVGHYPVQHQDKELINVLNRISDFKVWSPVYSHPKLRSIRDRSVLEQVIKNKAGQTLLVWYWYEVAGEPVVNKLKAKFMQVMGLLSGHPGASVIAIASQWSEDPSEVEKILEEFSAFIETRVDIRRL
jgi:EpsI family protein